MAHVRSRLNRTTRSTPPASDGYTPTMPSRSRSLLGQFFAVLLQPGQFFRDLTLDSRQWVWIALLILLLTGISAVKHQSALVKDAAGTDLGGGVGEIPSSDPFASDPYAGGGEMPGMGDTAEVEEEKSPEEVSADWKTGVTAASNMLLVWLSLGVLLSSISLLNGNAPRLGLNLQVVVWASLPLGLMAGLQLIYFWMGGGAGDPGISGLLPEWERYKHLSAIQQDLLYSFTMRLTLFGLWMLALVYCGARYALRGRVWAVALIVLTWTLLFVIVPVVLGTVEAPEVEAETPAGMDEIPMDGMMDEMGVPVEGQFGAEGGMDEMGEPPQESDVELPASTEEATAEVPLEKEQKP
ncbi:MAG TPA: hypothetical protein VHP83_14460 [Aggregatilineaceae bacterium]|nr:hypothetical protein [Aggregatilineaceae bacterium]